MDEDHEKMAKTLKTFSPLMVQNPYYGIPTFYGIPF